MSVMDYLSSSESVGLFSKSDIPTLSIDGNTRISGVTTPPTITGTAVNSHPSSSRREKGAVPTKQQLEKKFPNIHYLINQRTEWDAMFKILKITEEAINNKKIYNKDLAKSEIPELQKLYKDWWTVVRNSQTLHEGNVRRLSKYLRTFIITALEEPTHTVNVRHVSAKARIKAKTAVKKPSPKSHLPSVGSSRISFHPSKHYRKIPEDQSTNISRETSVKSGKDLRTYLSVRMSNNIHEGFSRPSSSMMGSKQLVAVSPMSLESTISLPTYPTLSIPDVTSGVKDEGTKESQLHLETSSTKLEEMYYMQIILKDILKDLSTLGDVQPPRIIKRPMKSIAPITVNARRTFVPRITSHPPTPRIMSGPISTKSGLRIVPTITPGQKALNEMKLLRKGLWANVRINDMLKRHPNIVQETKNFHIKKSLMTPQERAKTIMRSNAPSGFTMPVRNLGVKRVQNS